MLRSKTATENMIQRLELGIPSHDVFTIILIIGDQKVIKVNDFNGKTIKTYVTPKNMIKLEGFDDFNTRKKFIGIPLKEGQTLERQVTEATESNPEIVTLKVLEHV